MWQWDRSHRTSKGGSEHQNVWRAKRLLHVTGYALGTCKQTSPETSRIQATVNHVLPLDLRIHDLLGPSSDEKENLFSVPENREEKRPEGMISLIVSVYLLTLSLPTFGRPRPS